MTINSSPYASDAEIADRIIGIIPDAIRRPRRAVEDMKKAA
jgi:hypothetical protein